MALWQISFFVLPKEAIGTNSVFKRSDEGLFDDSKFWEKSITNPLVFESVEKFLPILNKSWGQYLTIYGSENSNRLEVISEMDHVESVSFRIDFTSDYEDILSQLIEFFIFNNLVVLDQNLSELPLNLESFKSLIQNSAQVDIYSQLSSKQQ